MIVVDTSALLAVMFAEPEGARCLARLKQARRALICSASVLEARMVTYGRLGPRGVVLLDQLLHDPAFEIVAPGVEEIDAAYGAFVVYGKGSGHPAGLNFGDVFAYALAKTRRLPLLFKGNDFTHTDVTPALG